MRGLITQSERLEQALAVPFGAGIGMTFDEAALLLELRDVYWSREGVLSVQLSLGTSGLWRRRSSPCGCFAAASASPSRRA